MRGVYSRTLDLKNAGIDVGTWHVLAQDPKAWTEIFMDRDNIHIRPENPYYFGQLPVPSNPRPQTYAEVVMKLLKEIIIEVPKPIDSDCVVLNSPTSPISRTVPLNISPPKIVETVKQQILSQLPSTEAALHISEPQPLPVVTTLRRSARLATKDEARGGRRVYSSEPILDD